MTVWLIWAGRHDQDENATIEKSLVLLDMKKCRISLPVLTKGNRQSKMLNGSKTDKLQHLIKEETKMVPGLEL